MAYKPGKGAVAVTVSKLPPPDRLMKGGGGAEAKPKKKAASMDVGKMSAFEDLVSALGVKPRDAEAGMHALSDFVKICYGDDEE